jgi:hypothetical protein
MALSAPPSLEQSLQLALAARPDLKLARLTEDVAAAGLRLAHAQTIPDLILSGRYTVNRSSFDNTPLEDDPERPFFENSVSETKDLRSQNSPKRAFPGSSSRSTSRPGQAVFVWRVDQYSHAPSSVPPKTSARCAARMK